MASTSQKDFFDFVSNQQPEAVGAENPVDWDKERDEWLEFLQKLYAAVEGFLKGYIEDGKIRVSYSEVLITEDDVGTYTAQEMHIFIGRKVVKLVPVGTMFIGTKGRVDIIGTNGKSRLTLAGKDTTSPRQLIDATAVKDWVWKIVSAPPTVRFLELNEDTLFQVLMEVSDG